MTDKEFHYRELAQTNNLYYGYREVMHMNGQIIPF